jgi:hypothetical protein
MLTQAARRDRVIGVIGAIRHLIEKADILIADQSARPAVEFSCISLPPDVTSFWEKSARAFSDAIATKQGIFPSISHLALDRFPAFACPTVKYRHPDV